MPRHVRVTLLKFVLAGRMTVVFMFVVLIRTRGVWLGKFARWPASDVENVERTDRLGQLTWGITWLILTRTSVSCVVNAKMFVHKVQVLPFISRRANREKRSRPRNY